MELSNHKLVTAILGGEAHLYGELVRRFDDRVRDSLKRRVRDPATVDDLVQQVFYKAFRQLDKVDDVEKLEGWLVTIARNCVVDHLRSRQARVKREESYTSRGRPLSYAAGEDNWVWDEVRQLSPAHAKVLLLRYRAGLTYQEMSQRLNVPLSTIRGRLQDARRRLEERLKGKGLFP